VRQGVHRQIVAVGSIAGQVEEDLACRPLTAPGGQECIDDRILNIAVTEPILHEAQIGTGLQQVGGDGVLEAMEVPFGGRQAAASP
jgi:hypothetical protein